MYVVLGASGNVGSEVLAALEPTGEKLIAVVHGQQQADAIAGGNIEPVVVDLADADALRTVLQRGRRAFLLNPPGNPGGDAEADELRTARAIAAALDGSGLEKVVVASTYGARPQSGVGDLGVLHEVERLVAESGIPCAINRGAYYFTNLDMLLEPAQQGSVPTAFPAELPLPMASPVDLGTAAADRLVGPLDDTGIVHVEGPERYSFADVAAAFAAALRRPVAVATTPREQWEESFRAVGFSPETARSYAQMTAATIDDPELPANPRRGRVTLQQHVANLA